jgi:hypothetical protein
MAGRIPESERFGTTKRRIGNLERETEDLSRFDGAQYLKLYEKMLALIANLQETVTNLVNTLVPALTYTREEVDTKVASPGDIAPNDVNASGNVGAATVTSAGTVSAGGELSGASITTPGATYIGGGVRAPGVRATPISTFRTVVQDDDGNMGYSSSALRTKQDISAADMTEDEFLSIGPYWFRMKNDVEANGEAAAWHFGFIAEHIIAAGYPHFAFFDRETGAVEGLNYDRLTAPLWGRLAAEIRQRRELETKFDLALERIAALEQRLNIDPASQGD